MNYELAQQARTILDELDGAEALIAEAQLLPTSLVPEHLGLTTKQEDMFDEVFVTALRAFIAQRKAELEAL